MSPPPVSKATALPADEQVGALPGGSTPPDTVTLFCGAGVQGAHTEVTALAASCTAPIGHTLRGKEWIQYDNPHDVG